MNQVAANEAGISSTSATLGSSQAPGNTVWCELAVIDGRPTPAVLIEISGGRFASVKPGSEPGSATRLGGITLPGLANAHSHAFHRALRSRVQADKGTFWTWRDVMYRAARRLDPDNYFRLARATFAEMALAGVTCVGEFHYVHHQVDGTPYDDPNATGLAIQAAADAAGVRLTLLDTLYLHGGLGRGGYSPVDGAQQRFSDGSVDEWIDRVSELKSTGTQRIGAAIHSIRAVAPHEMGRVGEWATSAGAPVHAHVSEQQAENEASLGFHGSSPIELLSEAGLLSARFGAVHGTHLTQPDVAALAAAGATVIMCPTTERDLGDGIGPTDRFASHRIPMALGSDSHAVIDLFQEARAVELHERLRAQARGIHTATDLLAMATVHSHRSLGWTDAGAIATGNRADLVTVRRDSVRTAGVPDSLAVQAAIFAASAGDVTSVFADGRRIVAGARHSMVDDVAADLDTAIRDLLDHG